MPQQLSDTTAYLRNQIDWPQAFPPEEYDERRRKVRRALAAAGIDAIYVTQPADLTYLTGYDMIWYHTRAMTGLLLRADGEERLWFDETGHATIVATTPEIGEVVWFDEASGELPIRRIVGAFAERGLGRGRIALQPWGYSPHARVTEALAEAFRAGGAEVVEASHLIEEIRLVKSPLEIAVVREAAAMADRAMAAGRDAIAEGVKETEIEAAIMHSLMTEGGGYPGIRSMVGSGPRAGTHHSAPTHRRIRRGDLVFVDFCSALHRYHVNLNRTFSLGAPDERWTRLMQASAGCVERIVAEVKPGNPWSRVAAVGEAYLQERDLARYVWWAGGYALGISLPPDWTGAYFARPIWGMPERPIEPGMVFNYENQFDVWEDWPGGSGAAYIESLLVTESGLEILSGLPRHLVAV